MRENAKEKFAIALKLFIINTKMESYLGIVLLLLENLYYITYDIGFAIKIN